MLFEKTLSEEKVFEGRVFTIQVDKVELQDGRTSTREVVNHNGGACIVPVEGNKIYFVRQFRYAFKEVLLEVPAGKLEKGEDPLDAAIREQREETGTIGTNYINLGEIYPTCGYCNEIIYMYACRVTEHCDMDLDEGEFVEVEKIDIDKALEMVENGEIKDAKTQIAIMKTHALIKNNKL